MTHSQRIPQKRLLVALLVLFASNALAEDWSRYENQHFIVYSQAKEKRVKALIEELELFRIAALKVFALRPPAGAPKTIVVVAKNKKEFRSYGGDDNVVGFARREGKRTMIVMPAIGRQSRSLNTMRHEYAHALLGYDEFDYPNWYDEGFAELASLISIEEDQKSFVLGLGTERRLGRGEVAVPWNALIGDNFSPHRQGDWFTSSAAYGQCWLLMHYLSLGPNADYARMLAIYVQDLKSGTNSIDAFKAAFGKTPQDLWDEEMHDYTSRLPFYRIPFDAPSLSSEFTKTVATTQDINPIVSYLTATSVTEKSKHDKATLPSDYPGLWSIPLYHEQCTKPIEVRDDGSGAMAIRWQWPDDGESPSFVSYTVSPASNGSLLFKQTSTTDSSHGIVPEFVLSQRVNGKLCIAHPDSPRYTCDQAYERCQSKADTVQYGETPSAASPEDLRGSFHDR